MLNFRKPDLSAVRYRVKRQNIINDEYKTAFEKKHPNCKNFSRKELKKIITLFNTRLWQKVIEHRDGIELPEGLGNVFVGSCPRVEKENIDYGKSIKYGTKVTHKNYDTDGHVSKIFYTNYNVKYKIQDRKLWGFNACRYFKRAVTQAFKEDFKKYIVVDNTTKVSHLYKQMFRYEKKMMKVTAELEFYDEFDMT
jgi:hypothetical protein